MISNEILKKALKELLEIPTYQKIRFQNEYAIFEYSRLRDYMMVISSDENKEDEKILISMMFMIAVDSNNWFNGFFSGGKSIAAKNASHFAYCVDCLSRCFSQENVDEILQLAKIGPSYFSGN